MREPVGQHNGHDAGRYAQGPCRHFDVDTKVSFEPSQHQKKEEVRIPFHAFTRIEHDPPAACQIEGIAKGDEGVLGPGAKHDVVGQSKGQDKR